MNKGNLSPMKLGRVELCKKLFRKRRKFLTSKKKVVIEAMKKNGKSNENITIPLCGEGKGMLFMNSKGSKNLHEFTKKAMAFSLQQLLNEQRVQRMPGFSSFIFKSFPLRFGSWKIGTLNSKGMEVHQELRKRRIDICCLQEVR